MRRIAETIERAANAQAQLIDDLLEISRIVTGKLKMELQAVSLVSVVRTAVDAIGPYRREETPRGEAQSR